MKIAKYSLLNGEKLEVPYDETAPCKICGEPVEEASTSGTVICPWCDLGKCRYCGKSYLTGKENTAEECLEKIREHIKECKQREQVSDEDTE